MFLKKNLFSMLVALLSVSVCQAIMAGGIAPGATRIIYSESKTQASLSLSNSDARERYLVQAWVVDEKGQRAHDFIVTPPLFTVRPKSENTLRIVYTGKPLAADREVVYWINIKAIPAISKDIIKDANTLQLAVLSHMKLFMRPDGLTMSEKESAEHLRFQRSGNQLTIINPTPYFNTLVNISVGNQKVKNSMVSPFGQLLLTLPERSSRVLHYQTVNDYGAVSPQRTGIMQ